MKRGALQIALARDGTPRTPTARTGSGHPATLAARGARLLTLRSTARSTARRQLERTASRHRRENDDYDARRARRIEMASRRGRRTRRTSRRDGGRAVRGRHERTVARVDVRVERPDQHDLLVT